MMLGEELVKNPHYPSVHPHCTRRPSQSTALGLKKGITLYQLVEGREDLSFLNQPERFIPFFKELEED
jgi:hypothetical protein